MKMIGIFLAICELSIFLITTFLIRKYSNYLIKMNTLQYYWLAFTIITGLWEVFFILNYKKTTNISRDFIKNNKHVWTSEYGLNQLLPWEFSQVFYGEYGAYADKMYMTTKGIWSRIIESTHAIFCGIFAFLALVFYKETKTGVNNKFVFTMAVAMGSQLMNSLLYMGEYFIQINDSYSVNYNTSVFPTGFALLQRPFMYINIFWTLMPALIIFKNLVY